MSKALFLDRDGIINVDKGYLYKAEDAEFTKGIFRLLKTAGKLGFDLFVITNQSGIARGMYSESEMNELHEWMSKQLRKEGVLIKKFYHCPHHPDISGNCGCRKPEPGMIKNAEKEFGTDISSSVVIGDKESDVLCGKNAGTGFNILVKSIYAKETVPSADYFAKDLPDAEKALIDYCGA